MSSDMTDRVMGRLTHPLRELAPLLMSSSGVRMMEGERDS